ncbi:MAG: phage Gaia [Bacteroidota bacterium]|jgi:predicted phosphoadenosine phosphosulfate sulfurtransferase
MKPIGMNVYDASVDRIQYILNSFNRVYVSFSGGKDSGVMLNMVIDELRKNYPGRKVGVMVMDNEANYTLSLDFMHRIIRANLDVLEVYWCCLPITLPCTVSSYEIDWQCWGINDEHRWIRPMPKDEYIVNIENNRLPFFKENMGYQEFWDEFGEWYSQGEDCACLIGIRTHESLNRWRAIVNENKQTHGGHLWTKRNTKHTYNCYPIYDWRTEDIWIANCKFEWDYNELYDTFWKAGLSIHQMRVASPFMSESKSSLNLYRIIDPHVWATLCARVNGANFVATYGKQLSYNSFKLPPGHTWKSFVKFLLDTLPEKSSKNFKSRFIQSIKYWGRVGRGLPESIINELIKHKISFKINGNTAHGNKDKRRVVIQSMPDHLDMLSCHNSDVASWKRFAITVLKNDHTCKYLGLSPTKEQIERMKYIKKKYSRI